MFSKLRLAEAGNLPTAEVSRISLGGFLHDLRKIATADEVLNKPGALTNAEYRQVQLHPGTGHRLLAVW